jgi:hypothetical protein
MKGPHHGFRVLAYILTVQYKGKKGKKMIPESVGAATYFPVIGSSWSYLKFVMNFINATTWILFCRVQVCMSSYVVML